MRTTMLCGSFAALCVITFASCEPSSTELAKEDTRQEAPLGDVATPLAWPDNEPAGMTPLITIDGSSLNWESGRNPSSGWLNDRTRLDVVEDPQSKYGFAIEKRFFVGDPSGWNGAVNTGPFIADHRKLYMRFVWRISPNWDFHASGVDSIRPTNHGRDAMTAIIEEAGVRCSG